MIWHSTGHAKACQEISIRPEWPEEGGIEVGGGDGGHFVWCPGFYSMCNENPQEGFNGGMV